jgi:hypothetical protein
MILYSTLRALAAAGAFILIVGATATVLSQEQEKAQNLKVLDTTLSHDELIAIMGSYTVALGVHCDHCHARSGDPKSRDMDWASDSVPAKLTAREMIKMMRVINGDFIGKISGLDTPRVEVECVTCHRGQERPQLIGDVLDKARASGGMVALDSVYRVLRQKYYGSHTYDFSEFVLVHLAMEVAEENDSNALTILSLNREFNPKSAFTEWATGQIYAEMGDTAAAISSMEIAIEYNPNYRRAKRDLDLLKGGKKP